MDYKITNIKISVKCQNISLDTVKQHLEEDKIFFRVYNNYIVTKDKYTYIIFKKNLKNTDNTSHVNITNIKSLEYLSEAINKLCLFDKNTKLLNYTIDNITVSKNFNRKLNISEILLKIPNHISVTYNSEIFPGIFLKFPQKAGTAILFHTGKCVLLGCKTYANIENILLSLSTILNYGNV
jgi:TATA-box binding protein (TBP) (component of TFIID and TFIIIB)